MTCCLLSRGSWQEEKFTRAWCSLSRGLLSQELTVYIVYMLVKQFDSILNDCKIQILFRKFDTVKLDTIDSFLAACGCVLHVILLTVSLL